MPGIGVRSIAQIVVADELAERQVHADALHVPGRVKRQYAGVDVVEQRLKVRRLGLIHPAKVLLRP